MPVPTPFPRRAPRWRWCLLLFVPLAAPASDDVRDAWRLVADHLNRDAAVRLSRSRESQTRARRLAEATVAIDAQPVTQERLRAAEAELAALAAGDDEIAAAAGYLRGRLYQVHFQQLDLPRAAALYRELADRQPRSHWAQLGLVKLGLLTLYALPEPSAPAERIAAAAALRPRLQEKELGRDLDLQLGRAVLFYGLPPAQALPHLLAADRAGGLIGQAYEDLIVMIGELSMRTGDYAQARAYFERYEREVSYNMRVVTVRRRLEELAALERAAREAKR
ncbi:MAG: hypothetical protein JSR48_04105 [Verrucomicrobia bacterium]|nr:hypothetical protein [Verrucomicrobiota bacterium]